MADTETTETETSDASDLHNTFIQGTYSGEDDEGYRFELNNGETAIVDPGEFEGDAPFEEGDELELLVEQEKNGAWTASARKVEKLELWAWMEEARKNQTVVDGDILKENKGGLSVDIGLRAFLPRSHVELHKVDDCAQYVGRSERFTIIKFDKKRCNIVVSRRKVLEQEREERKRETIEEIEEGKVFEGTVRNLKPYGAFVDIGGVDGLLHISNIGWKRIDHPSEVLEPGQRIEVEVLEFEREEERLSLGRKQLLDDPWEEFEASHQEGDVIEGEVVSLADFGAFVEVAPGLEGLVHVTELSWTDRNNHPGEVLSVGDEVEVKIIDIDTDKRRVGLSVKQLRPNPWEELDEGVELGDVIEGEITNITDFGMFVKVMPDIEGLVHVSDLSWTEQISDISNHYEVGEKVEAKVLELDVDAQRLGLGVKQLTEDPWEKAEKIAKPGEKIDVTVTKLTDFGAFAEVVEGVEGLIHISELAERRIDHPREVTRPGDEVEALVLKFDRKGERIGLSLKKDQLEEEVSEYTEDEDSSTKFGDVFGDKLGEMSSVVQDESEEEEAEAEAEAETADRDDEDVETADHDQDHDGDHEETADHDDEDVETADHDDEDAETADHDDEDAETADQDQDDEDGTSDEGSDEESDEEASEESDDETDEEEKDD